MNDRFDEIYNNALDGWGFSFRRSQIYIFQKYIDIFKKSNIKGRIFGNRLWCWIFYECDVQISKNKQSIYICLGQKRI